MKAMVLRAYGGRLEAAELPCPTPAPGELLVAVRAAGLCGTDLKIIQGKLDVGPLPHILGHEIAGVVVGRGDEADAGWMGKRVALHLYSACGACSPCRKGEYNMCASLPGRLGFEMPGGLAQYVVCPERCAVEISAPVSFEQACVAPCAMLTICHAARRGGVAAGDRVALIGVGGLGIHGVQLLSGLGAHVTAVDVVEKKLAFAMEMGAGRAVLFPDFLESGETYDVLVDMIGKPAAARDMFYRKLARGGRYVMVSFVAGNEMHFDCQHLAMDECSIVGVRNGTMDELRDTLAYQARGSITPIIDAALPLEQANEALDLIREGKLMGRVVITHQTE